jgi:small subunit ribosomal protein S5
MTQLPARTKGEIRSREGGEREFDEEVVKIYRCATVVKGGRRFSFSALVVVGDRNGRVGIGYGKAPEVPSAVDKARKIAIRGMKPVTRRGTTIPHRMTVKYGASKLVLVPASPGTGVIAGASARPVLELAGIRDVLTKSYGSNSPKNLVRATYKALTGLLDRQQVAQLRGVELGGRV